MLHLLTNTYATVRPAASIGIPLLLLLVSTSCTMSNAEIARTVQTSMQEKFNTDPNVRQLGLLVNDVQVVRIEGNSFRGLATIAYKGQTYSIDVDVTADGQNVLWTVDPSEFLFVAQEELLNLFELFRQQQ